eukprot:UN14002
MWENTNALSEGVDEFSGLVESFEDNLDCWKEWFFGEDLKSLPDPWNQGDKLSSFGYVLLIKTLKEDLTMSVIKGYVVEKLGRTFVEPPPFDLDTAFGDSNSATPIVFVLSSGADPMSP